MTELTRRERMRAATEMEIRQHARALLVSHGRDAVTLRAIARELGITAPALYRYYNSREALLRQLCDDICTDLAAGLRERLEAVADDYFVKVFAVCRGFRQWALAHPQEFTLVFATPLDEKDTAERGEQDQFASVFLGIVGPLMIEGAFKVQSGQSGAAPFDLEEDLAVNRRALESAFSHEGIDMPPEALGTDSVYFLLRWWVRLYGHIALEVFGRFPFDLSHADRLFGSLLNELANEVGIAKTEATQQTN